MTYVLPVLAMAFCYSRIVYVLKHKVTHELTRCDTIQTFLVLLH